jgi:hypothetical protein
MTVPRTPPPEPHVRHAAALRARLALALALACGSAACGSTAGSDPRGAAATAGAQSEPAGAEPGGVAGCAAECRTRFLISLPPPQRCADLTPPGGLWEVEALDREAPPASFCFVVARGDVGAADVAALEQAVAATGEGVIAPACGVGGASREGELLPIPQIDFIPTHAGANGCDVCGFRIRNRVYAILPSDRVVLRQFELAAPQGGTRAFAIRAASEARAVSLPLPAEGLETHGSGYVRIY